MTYLEIKNRLKNKSKTIKLFVVAHEKQKESWKVLI